MYENEKWAITKSNRYHIGNVTASHNFINVREINKKVGDQQYPIPSQDEIDNIRPMDMVKVNLAPGERFFVYVMEVGTNGFRGLAWFTGPVVHGEHHGAKFADILTFNHEHVMDIVWSMCNAPKHIFEHNINFIVKAMEHGHDNVVLNLLTNAPSFSSLRYGYLPWFVYQQMKKPSSPQSVWFSNDRHRGRQQGIHAEEGLMKMMEFWIEGITGSPYERKPCDEIDLDRITDEAMIRIQAVKLAEQAIECGNSIAILLNGITGENVVKKKRQDRLWKKLSN